MLPAQRELWAFPAGPPRLHTSGINAPKPYAGGRQQEYGARHQRNRQRDGLERGAPLVIERRRRHDAVQLEREVDLRADLAHTLGEVCGRRVGVLDRQRGGFAAPDAMGDTPRGPSEAWGAPKTGEVGNDADDLQAVGRRAPIAIRRISEPRAERTTERFSLRLAARSEDRAYLARARIGLPRPT